MKGLGIPILLEPAAKTLDDAYAEMTQLGVATGHAPGATTLVQGIKSKVQALSGKVAHRSKPLTYYYELDQTLYTATSHTFVGSLFNLVGLQNIADRSTTGTATRSSARRRCWPPTPTSSSSPMQSAAARTPRAWRPGPGTPPSPPSRRAGSWPSTTTSPPGGAPG